MILDIFSQSQRAYIAALSMSDAPLGELRKHLLWEEHGEIVLMRALWRLGLGEDAIQERVLAYRKDWQATRENFSPDRESVHAL